MKAEALEYEAKLAARRERQELREKKKTETLVSSNEQAERAVKEEAKRAFDERVKQLDHEPRMGYFDLVPDEEWADTEVLTNEQVYQDLQKLQGILGTHEEPINMKSLAVRKKIKTKRK